MTWLDQAACRGKTALFFSEGTVGKRHDLSKPEAICASCPVRAECLDQAMRDEDGHGRLVRDGYRGGMTADQRWRYQARWKRGHRADAAFAAMRNPSSRQPDTTRAEQEQAMRALRRQMAS